MNFKKHRLKGLIACIALCLLPLSVAPVAADNNPAAWIMCSTEDGRELYKLATTDVLAYSLMSKSAVVTVDSVNSTYNKLLELTGVYNFTETNNAVLGRPLKSETSQPSTGNGGPKINPFERFGFAGLTWSSYLGEWKYNFVDPCASNPEVQPTNFGAFYENRKEPKTTYTERSTSEDPRTLQFNEYWSKYTSTLNDILANSWLSLAKGSVAIAIALIGFSMSDVTWILGGDKTVEVFQNLYDNFFLPLVVVMILLTGINIIYNGFFKRKIREVLVSGVLQTILCFAAAIIIGTNPAFWVPLPNNLTLLGQSVIMSAIGGQQGNDPLSLCGTDTGSLTSGFDSQVNPDGSVASLTDQIKEINKGMQAVMGCRLWQEALFKPWVLGQFGYEYEELEYNTGSVTKDIINKSWVGTPVVPLGSGKAFTNWALFQLSTQTDAHSAIKIDTADNYPEYINGIPTDWWRIVDAMSNYHEEVISGSNKISAGDKNDIGGEVVFVDQVDSEPTLAWGTWVGNNKATKGSTAFFTFMFAFVACIGLIVLSGISVVYGLGVTFLTILAPVFLLLGCWAGRGREALKGWFGLLLNTIIRRILITVIILLSFTLMLNLLELTNTIGQLKAFLLFAVLSYAMIANRQKIIDMFASVNFGGISANPAKSLFNTTKRFAKNTSTVGLSFAAGGVAGSIAGVGFGAGAKAAGADAIRNAMYTNAFSRRMVTSFDASSGKDSTSRFICAVCGADIPPGAPYLYNPEKDGLMCDFCSKWKAPADLEDYVYRVRASAKSTVNLKREVVSTKSLSKIMKYGLDDKGNINWDTADVQQEVLDQMTLLGRNMIAYDLAVNDIDGEIDYPTTPEALFDYIDEVFIAAAWSRGRYDLVEAAYKEAWAKWYIDNEAATYNPPEAGTKQFMETLTNHGTFAPATEGYDARTYVEAASQQVHDYLETTGEHADYVKNPSTLSDEKMQQATYIPPTIAETKHTNNLTSQKADKEIYFHSNSPKAINDVTKSLTVSSSDLKAAQSNYVTAKASLLKLEKQIDKAPNDVDIEAIKAAALDAAIAVQTKEKMLVEEKQKYEAKLTDVKTVVDNIAEEQTVKATLEDKYSKKDFVARANEVALRAKKKPNIAPLNLGNQTDQELSDYQDTLAAQLHSTKTLANKLSDELSRNNDESYKICLDALGVKYEDNVADVVSNLSDEDTQALNALRGDIAVDTEAIRAEQLNQIKSLNTTIKNLEINRSDCIKQIINRQETE